MRTRSLRLLLTFSTALLACMLAGQEIFISMSLETIFSVILFQCQLLQTHTPLVLLFLHKFCRHMVEREARKGKNRKEKTIKVRCENGLSNEIKFRKPERCLLLRQSAMIFGTWYNIFHFFLLLDFSWSCWERFSLRIKRISSAVETFRIESIAIGMRYLPARAAKSDKNVLVGTSANATIFLDCFSYWSNSEQQESST